MRNNSPPQCSGHLHCRGGEANWWAWGEVACLIIRLFFLDLLFILYLSNLTKIPTNSVTAIPYRWAWGEMAWDWGKEELQAVNFTQDSLTKFHYVYLAGFWHRSTRFISSLNTCIDELVAVCPYMLKVWYNYIILKTNWVRIGYWQKLQVWVGYRVLIGHRLYRNE